VKENDFIYMHVYVKFKVAVVELFAFPGKSNSNRE